MSRSQSDESSSEEEEDRRQRRQRKEKRRRDVSDNEQVSDDDRRRKRRERKSSSRRRSGDDYESSDDEDRQRKRRKKSSRRKKRKKKKGSRKRKSSSSEDDGSSDDGDRQQSKKVVNQRLLAKLEARGETLEEREARRAQRRAARITAATGYTAEDNPFNDPNLHETFTWKKKQEQGDAEGKKTASRQAKQDNIFEEIDKVRRRRKERADHFEELERIRAEESRMKELENYDEWARKEEEFHLQQQRQRSAIRLVEGREKPVDVLAKNLLMFGLSEEDRKNNASVKYEEKYNAINDLANLEAELQEPHEFLKVLKLEELEELMGDIETFRTLEREAVGGYGSHESPIIAFWDNLKAVTKNEISFLKAGGKSGSRAATIADINKLFDGQSVQELLKMRNEVGSKVRRSAVASFDQHRGGVVDVEYWKTVAEQLDVHLARMALSEFHSKMLVRQLEHLEQRKLELDKESANKRDKSNGKAEDDRKDEEQTKRPEGIEEGFGDLEEELGLVDEVAASGAGSYSWEDRFRPRKPRYFNRVKTGYDWNKYNQTHYDHDNPPPKSVQGYKFNIFYPDLIDKTKTPQFVLQPADSDDFCILRFKAGPPYEDIAFKIINREWNRSRKRGFRCSFERGVLSLYFNFKTHWYRR